LLSTRKCIWFLFFGANARFEPKTRKRWLDKTDAYPLVYVSIWTARFDAVFGSKIAFVKKCNCIFWVNRDFVCGEWKNLYSIL